MGGQKRTKMLRVRNNRERGTTTYTVNQRAMFDEWEQQLFQRYQNFTGVDPFDFTERIFTEGETIERYARDLAFWFSERGKLGEVSDSNLKRYNFLADLYGKVIDRIGNRFSKAQQLQITKRASELVA